MGRILAFLRMAGVGARSGGRAWLRAHTALTYSPRVSIITSWGLRVEAIAFGSGPGYKGRDKGYSEKSGQEVMVGVGGEDNYIPRLSKGYVNRSPEKEIRELGEREEGQGARCPVGQPKGFRWFQAERQGLGKLVGQTGVGAPALQEQGCSGPLRMEERIPATQRPLLPSPQGAA